MATRNLPSVFDYLDYVKYIREYYEARHSIDRWFSYRYIQSKTGIDPGYLFKVFMGKKPLPQKKTNALAAMLGLTKRETEYFTLLVMYGQAKSNETIRRYFERMLTFREVVSRTVAAKEYVYYTKWYHAAIRQLLSCADFKGDYRSLARMTVPPISEGEAKKTVALLCSLGFVKKGADGVFRVTDRFLTTGDGWQSIAIRRFQQDTIMLAQGARYRGQGPARYLHSHRHAFSRGLCRGPRTHKTVKARHDGTGQPPGTSLRGLPYQYPDDPDRQSGGQETQ
jgi:uncharacterized protein (TIGR02147 family)